MSFKKNFVSLLSWTTLSQAFSILTLPLLTALYPPDAFGILAIFFAIQSFISSVFTLRFEWHIPNCDNRRDAFATALLAIIIHDSQGATQPLRPTSHCLRWWWA